MLMRPGCLQASSKLDGWEGIDVRPDRASSYLADIADQVGSLLHPHHLLASAALVEWYSSTTGGALFTTNKNIQPLQCNLNDKLLCFAMSDKDVATLTPDAACKVSCLKI
jgi:hypothetical protein